MRKNNNLCISSYKISDIIIKPKAGTAFWRSRCFYFASTETWFQQQQFHIFFEDTSSQQISSLYIK